MMAKRATCLFGTKLYAIEINFQIFLPFLEKNRKTFCKKIPVLLKEWLFYPLCLYRTNVSDPFNRRTLPAQLSTSI